MPASTASHLLRDLVSELRPRLAGSLRVDEVSRRLYATDASLYEILPLGVVYPCHAEDVATTVELAARHRVPLLPRGAGTSLAGQTVGAALVLDFSVHMRELLESHIEPSTGGTARVQPGLVLDELNAQLRPRGVMFAPDVATSNRATLGGMMGNNSCGARSMRYGKTLDHVLEQRVVLSDGTGATLQELDAGAWRAACGRPGIEGAAYSAAQYLAARHADEVDRRYPRIMRRVGGYNLDELVRRGRRNLACLTVGSEGTLAVVTEAVVNLVPVPPCTGLLVSLFAELLPALEAVPGLVALRPSAVELVDRVILDGTRNNPALHRARSAFLQGDPAAILVTEFSGAGAAAVRGQLREAEEQLRSSGCGYHHVPLLDAPLQRHVWEVRKAGLGLLMGMKGDAKPVGFIEDTAVPVERLADYIRELHLLLQQHGLEASYYAHAGVGCLHVRPIMNLKHRHDRALLRTVASAVADLVLRYGGAMSAEHGDGIARSEWQERMFGPALYQAFRELKAAFDPHGILNPGKIVDAPPMDQALRLHTGDPTPPVLTVLDFSRDGGLARAVELCSGVGACRKRLDGVMCPSYRATLDERDTTRARANLLRAALAGALDPLPGADPEADPLADPRLVEILDLCLECKACKSECPSNVDMARLKYEVLHHHQAAHGASLRSRLFAGVATSAPLGAAAAPLANRLLATRWVRALLHALLGISRERRLPRYAGRTFDAWWRERPHPASRPGRPRVLLLADTFTRYHEPENGEAAVQVLEAAGYQVEIPPLRCCGRPLFSKGFLEAAREQARHNVGILASASYAGVPLVGIEPSCVSTYRDEYRELGLGRDAEAVSARTVLLEELLCERMRAEPELPRRLFRPAGDSPVPVLVHPHCHQRAVLDGDATLAALAAVPGLAPSPLPPGCCGMAGSFGYEREHHELSLRIGELGLFPAVRAAAPEAIVVATGTSCRHQLADGTGRAALPPAVVLARALAERAGR